MLVLQLNEAARKCANKTTAKQLKDCAIGLAEARDALGTDLTLDKIRVLNDYAARGWRLLCKAANTPPVGGGAGKLKQGAKLAA